MRSSRDFQESLPHLFPEKRSEVLRSWQRPSFAEFVRQVEHEFGDTVDTSSLYLTHADRNEPLTPNSVRALCEQLGVPAEDFGV